MGYLEFSESIGIDLHVRLFEILLNNGPHIFVSILEQNPVS
jgi:hypothetical protein